MNSVAHNITILCGVKKDERFEERNSYKKQILKRGVNFKALSKSSHINIIKLIYCIFHFHGLH